MAEEKRLLAVTCEVLAREAQYAAARAARPVDLVFLSQGLHEVEKPGMAGEIQKKIDAADEGLYEAVVLGYALCNNGVVGLAARALPVVIPRAHDCIALLLGSRARYDAEFGSEPGTYYYSPGWLERDGTNMAGPQLRTVSQTMGLDRSYDDLVAEYGRENADFIWQQLKGGLENYTRAAYIAPPFEVPDALEASARAKAAEHDWKYQHLDGDLSLLDRLFAGDWPPEDFLVLAPGAVLAAGDPGGDIVRAGGEG